MAKRTRSQNAYAIQQSMTASEPDNFSISRALQLVPGSSHLLHISPEIREIFQCIQTDCGRPLPAFHSTKPVLSIFRKRLFTRLTDHFFQRYSEQFVQSLSFFLPENFNKTFCFICERHSSCKKHSIITQQCVFVRNGQYHNCVICIYILEIQKIKLAHTVKIDYFMTCNNQFCFCLKESRKINIRLGGQCLLAHSAYNCIFVKKKNVKTLFNQFKH